MAEAAVVILAGAAVATMVLVLGGMPLRVPALERRAAPALSSSPAGPRPT
jgi:hypothetical protein